MRTPLVERSTMQNTQAPLKSSAHHNSNAWQMNPSSKAVYFSFGALAALFSGVVMYLIVLAVQNRQRLCNNTDTPIESPKEKEAVIKADESYAGQGRHY